MTIINVNKSDIIWMQQNMPLGAITEDYYNDILLPYTYWCAADCQESTEGSSNVKH